MADETKPTDVEGLKLELARVSGEVKQFAADIIAKHEAGQTISAEVKALADKALNDQADIRARLLDLEQKATKRPGAGGQPEAQRTPGQIFIEDERVKAFCAARSKGRVRVDMAAVSGLTSAGGGALVVEQRIPGIVALPERRMTVRDLLTPGRTSSNAIQFVQEQGFTNLADVVSETTAKPESSITFELVTKAVATIAHYILASKQILDDAPMLQSHIDGRLRYGLAYVEEQQLLNGDGTGTNLHGLVPQASAYSAPFNPTDAQAIDTIRLALLQAELAEFPATGIVLHPTDWARIELTKDNDGRYIFAQPQSLAGPTLWSRPVVATQAMTVDKFLVGAFKLGAQVFDREDANVEISTEDSDNFRKNLVTIRAEERLVLAVYRPEAFIYGDFGRVT
jgi:HK97 family phage major capsid protein